MNVNERMKSAVRDVADFPKTGILFKDITPILSQPQLCRDIADELCRQAKPAGIDAVIGIESRGFLFGMLLAERLDVPFVPVRKRGKLPFHTVAYEYELE